MSSSNSVYDILCRDAEKEKINLTELEESFNREQQQQQKQEQQRSNFDGPNGKSIDLNIIV
jgi:hypothetical protein